MGLFVRRSLLIIALGILAASPLFSQVLPVATGRPERTKAPESLVSVPSTLASTVGDAPASGFESASAPLPVRQGHAGPEVFSIAVHLHPLLARFLAMYSSPAWLDWLDRVRKRADPFLGYIASRIAYYHLPPELLYLPIAESSYDPYAVSNAGAAGLWQLMAPTATSHHLTIDEWNDQRFDFWKATDASLQTLKEDYDALGSWPLALAAYDAGLGFMKRLVAKTGIHDYWTLAADGYLPQETVNYVPRFFAIAAVCSYPGRYGLPLSWSKPLEWTRIPLDGSVDLHLLADEADVNRQILMEGNAGLRYGITPPEGASLAVPKADSANVGRVLQGSKYDLLRFYIYDLKPGDTLAGLARYYGVPVSLILSYNPGVSASDLAVGTRLLIPAIKDLPPYHPPAPQPDAAPAGSPSAAPQPAPSLSGATRPRAVTPPPPVELPPLPETMPEAELTLSETGTLAAALPLRSIQAPSIFGAQPKVNSYIVRKGDTLWAIAARFHTTAAAIARANGLAETGIIHPGLLLRLPSG